MRKKYHPTRIVRNIKNNPRLRKTAGKAKNLVGRVCSAHNFWVYGIGCPPPSIIYASIYHLYNSRKIKKYE